MIEEQKKWKQQQTFFSQFLLSIDLLREDMTDAVSSTSFLHLFAVCCFDTWL